VIEATRDRRFDPTAAALHLRALANLDLEGAARLAAEVAARHPLAAGVHFVHAVLLLELGRLEESSRAIRRVTYLDRSLAVAHFTLGSILERAGDVNGARRAYRVARDLSAARPPSEILPLSDGEAAGRLVTAADAQLALLDRAPGALA
jgi:chemotaxis protein methyltransferase CheR